MAVNIEPDKNRTFGVWTDPVETRETGRVSIWDMAYGTDAKEIAKYLSGESKSIYWGQTEEQYQQSLQSQAEVYNKIQNLSRARTHGYIKNLRTGEIRKFQFNPEKLEYSRGVNYSDNVSPGMAYPKSQFVSGKIREFDVDLFLYDRQLEPSTFIKDYIEFLGQFLTPETNVESWKIPPEMLFFYGYFIRKCVLTNLNIKIDNMDECGTPTMATLTLTLRQVGVVT